MDTDTPVIWRDEAKEDLREVLVGNYRVLYIYLNNLITIIAVRHQASQLGKI